MVETADDHAFGQIEQQRLQPTLLVLDPSGRGGELVADRGLGRTQPRLHCSGRRGQPPQPGPTGRGQPQRRVVAGHDREVARKPIEWLRQALIDHEERAAQYHEPTRQHERHHSSTVRGDEPKRGATGQRLDRQQRKEQTAQQRGRGGSPTGGGVHPLSRRVGSSIPTKKGCSGRCRQW